MGGEVGGMCEIVMSNVSGSPQCDAKCTIICRNWAKREKFEKKEITWKSCKICFSMVLFSLELRKTNFFPLFFSAKPGSHWKDAFDWMFILWQSHWKNIRTTAYSAMPFQYLELFKSTVLKYSQRRAHYLKYIGTKLDCAVIYFAEHQPPGHFDALERNVSVTLRHGVERRSASLHAGCGGRRKDSAMVICFALLDKLPSAEEKRSKNLFPFLIILKSCCNDVSYTQSFMRGSQMPGGDMRSGTLLCVLLTWSLRSVSVAKSEARKIQIFSWQEMRKWLLHCYIS